MKLAGLGYRLVEVARTGDRFAGFGAYVASIDGSGAVAFYAETAAGAGIYRAAPDGAIAAISEAGAASHPAINDAGEVAYYRAGRLVRVSSGVEVELEAPATGPLGPTINSAGDVAFRFLSAAGEGVAVQRRDGSVVEIAAGGAYRGLPCAGPDGAVCYRAEEAIRVWRDGATETWASAPPLQALGRFPAIDDTGMAVFATGAGIAASRGPGSTAVVIAGDPFDSYRGALARGGEVAVFYATPRGGTLGVYSGPGDRLVGLGDRFGGGEVIDLALNPVSINRFGQLAIRMALAGGVGIIARADPRS